MQNSLLSEIKLQINGINAAKQAYSDESAWAQEEEKYVICV